MTGHAVIGTGLDLAPIARVARFVREHADVLGRVFTPGERARCERGGARRRDARYAEAFAAKEAVMKALGSGWSHDAEWSDIDTAALDERGGVTLSGGMHRAATARGIARVMVSVASTSEAAFATAIAERIARD